MITFLKGNIFDSTCDILVNPVNTVGVMGAGLALKFKSRYPGMFQRYFDDCRAGLLHVGSVKLYPVEFGTKFVACFPTKQHWKKPSEMIWLDAGLEDLKLKLHGRSCAIPRLGCGLGGLYWNDVRELINDVFLDSDEAIEVYE